LAVLFCTVLGQKFFNCTVLYCTCQKNFQLYYTCTGTGTGTAGTGTVGPGTFETMVMNKK